MKVQRSADTQDGRSYNGITASNAIPHLLTLPPKNRSERTMTGTIWTMRDLLGTLN
jgi:hypothetical protein